MADKKMEELKKPLDKMTVKELKEVALELPEITGVHGMIKADLLAAVKKAMDIEEEPKKKTSRTVREVKNKIRELKIMQAEALEKKDSKTAGICRRRISRLKKKTRRVA